MKHSVLSQLLRAAGLLLSVYVTACTEPIPDPRPLLETRKQAPLTVDQARHWYDSIYQAPTTLLPVDWSQARNLGDVVLLPVKEPGRIFAYSSGQGYRFLLVTHGQTTSLAGTIVELVLPDKRLSPEAAFTVAWEAYGQHCQQTLKPVGELSGRVLFYSPTYRYLAGSVYQAGTVMAHSTRLALVARSISSTQSNAGSGAAKPATSSAPPTTNIAACTPIVTDWYDGESGEYITTTYDYSNCQDEGGGGSPPPWGGTGSGGDGGESGGGNGPSGPADADPNTSQSVDSQLPPCVNNVLNNLLASSANGVSSSMLNAVLTALQRPNATMSVHFITSNGLASNTAGDCSYNASISSKTGRNDFTIRLNSAYLSGGVHGGATDLFIAQIILHETLHAALMDWALTNGSPANGVSFDNLLASFMAMQGLTPGNGQGQHDAMSLIVGELGNALYNYYTSTSIDHSGSLGSQYGQYTSLQDCTNLCWTGLESSVGYQWAVLHDPLFKLRCDAIHGAELTGQPAATGSQANNTLQQRVPAGVDPCP